MTSVTHASRSRRIRSTPPDRVAELTAQELQAPWSWTSTTPESDVGPHQHEVAPVGLHRRPHQVDDALQLLRRSARSASLNSVSVSGTPPFCRVRRLP